MCWHRLKRHTQGKWFPSKHDLDKRTLYHAAVLLFFRPWRSFRDLVRPGYSFEQEYDDFIGTTNSRILTLLENIQYYHDCSDQADKNRANVRTTTCPIDVEAQDHFAIDDNVKLLTELGTDCVLSEEDVNAARQSRIPQDERLHADVAITIGRDVHFFDAEAEPGPPQGRYFFALCLLTLFDFVFGSRRDHVIFKAGREGCQLCRPGTIQSVE